MKISLLVVSAWLVVPSVAVAGFIEITHLVTDSEHLLAGATVTSSVSSPDDFTWEVPAGFRPGGRYAAVDGPWVTTISGATGPGSAWNGNYAFAPIGSHDHIAITWNNRIYAPNSIRADGTGANRGAWTDGSKTFLLVIQSTSFFDEPDVGTLVDFSGKSFEVGVFFHSFGPSAAPSFTKPASGITTVTATSSGLTSVPEPTSALLLCIGVAGFAARGYRSRKRSGLVRD